LDDQEFLQEAIKAIDDSIHLVSFSTGVKFMNALSAIADEELPDLIVLDYNIPELNGAEILEQLSKQERYTTIPKIVWSTSDSELYRQNCLASGAKAYLVKPSSISGIASVAKEMLAYCC
jgi:CheY-like chemotaxis protein